MQIAVGHRRRHLARIIRSRGSSAFLLMGRAFCPLRHPRPRGRAPAVVLEPASQRLRGQLAARLPRVRAASSLPQGAHGAPQGRVRPRRARHDALRAAIPSPEASLRRKLTRDAFFVTRVEEPQGRCCGAARARTGRPIALRILATQLRVRWRSSPRSGGRSCTCCSGWRRG